MKHLFKNALVLLLVVIFTACNSGLSISKRRYNKGYYVHQSKRPDNKSKIARAPAKRTQKPEAKQAQALALASLAKPAVPTKQADLVTANAGDAAKPSEKSSLSA